LSARSQPIAVNKTPGIVIVKFIFVEIKSSRLAYCHLDECNVVFHALRVVGRVNDYGGDGPDSVLALAGIVQAQVDQVAARVQVLVDAGGGSDDPLLRNKRTAALELRVLLDEHLPAGLAFSQHPGAWP